MWSSFGTDFANMQTGIYDFVHELWNYSSHLKEGTRPLNACIDAFIATEFYKDLCTQYGVEGDCFQNEFFDNTDNEMMGNDSKPSNELTTSRSDGHYACP